MSVDDVSKRERTISGALALAMHVLFIVLLVVGISWQPKRTAAPIAVELWSELPPAPRPKPEPPPPAPEPPRPPPRPEPRPEPKPEVKPVPKPDIALKERLEKERKRKEVEERQLEEQKRKEEAKKRAEEEQRLAEQKKREEEKKRLAEQKKREDEKKKLAEQKRREEEKKQLAEKQRQEEIAKAKQKEEALNKLLAQQAADAEARSRLDSYRHVVSEKIKRYIVMPPNIQGNPEAIFEVVQIPGGEILSVKLKRSSGNPAYDAAVERAIHRASPLPPPPNGVRFAEVREFEAKFRPKE